MEILPVTRKEQFLKAAMDSEPLTIDAVTRIETYLSKISGADVTIPDPVTKIEMYLASIAGADVVLPDPVTRVEKYLAKLAGMDVLVPEPITRIEQFLSDWVNQPVGVLKTISGAVVFVSDALARAAEDISVKINPVQDLHGYSNPWVGGAGKNLFDCSTTIQAYINASGNPVNSNHNGCSGYIQLDANKNYIMSCNTTVHNIGYCLWDESKSTILSRADNNNVQSVQFASSSSVRYVRIWININNSTAMTPTECEKYQPQFEEGSTATAFEPYENLCPISGFTGVNIWRTRTNVCEEEFEDGYITASGALSSYQYAIRSKNYNSCVPNTQYYYKITTGISGVNIAWYDASKTFIQRDSDRGNTVITAPSNARFFKLSIYNYKSVNPTYSNDISINYPSTVTDYEPYQGNLYTIDLDGTVYGVTLNVTTGVLTVAYGMDDLSQLSWTLRKTGTVNKLLSSTFTNYYKPTNTNYAKIGMIAEDYVECGAYNASGLQTNIETADAGIYTFKEASSSKERTVYMVIDKNTSPSGKVVYPLATPITYQLTPTQIEMLEGNNTLWADTGDVTVTYMADGNANDVEALNILLGNRYVNLGEPDEATDREALDILLGGR